jgi:hypothetical protein
MSDRWCDTCYRHLSADEDGPDCAACAHSARYWNSLTPAQRRREEYWIGQYVAEHANDPDTGARVD